MLSKPVIEPNAIYSREEAAHLLGVSLSTLKYLIRAGHLAVSQPEGIRRVFIRGSCILDMLERTTRGSPRGIDGQTLVTDSETNQKQAGMTPSTRHPAWREGKYNDSSALRTERKANRLHRATGTRTRRKLSGAQGGASG